MHIIDVHNHSLPGIDDGAKNLAMSLSMLRVATQHGTKEIVLTPHHLNGAYTNFAHTILEQTKSLEQAAKRHGVEITLHAASEIHLVPETVDHLLEGKALTYGGHGKAALVELPKHTVPAGVERILSEMIYHGITPIIAHPERNTTLRQDYGQLKEWVEFGCKSQLTGQSCTGAFGSQLQRTALNMIDDGLVHIIASDSHRPHGRSPDLSLAVQFINEHYGSDVCNTLFNANPKKLISGDPLTDLPKINKSSNKSGRKQKTSNWRATLKRLTRPK